MWLHSPLKKTSPQQRQGDKFEQLARHYLEMQGLTFIAANQHFKSGELDLIMRDGTTTVFVEVRQRKNAHFGSAIESVDWQKQQRWLDAANLWLSEQEQSLEDADCRFDLVAFGANGDEITWIENFLDE